MAKEYLSLSDGTYTFTETDDEKVFYFYRNDEGKLGDVGRKPMHFYQTYITNKMFNSEITGPVFGNLSFETSDDGKYMRITVIDFKELPECESEEDSADSKKQPGIFKRIFEKIRKQKHKD